MNNNVSMRSLKIAHECLKHKVQAVSVLLWNRRSSRPLKESKSKQPKNQQNKQNNNNAELSTIHSRNSWIPEESLAQGRGWIWLSVY